MATCPSRELTATFRILYVFCVLAHDRCRVLHFNITEAMINRIAGERLRDGEAMADLVFSEVDHYAEYKVPDRSYVEAISQRGGNSIAVSAIGRVALRQSFQVFGASRGRGRHDRRGGFGPDRLHTAKPTKKDDPFWFESGATPRYVSATTEPLTAMRAARSRTQPKERR
jgi:hypothetical protein